MREGSAKELCLGMHLEATPRRSHVQKQNSCARDKWESNLEGLVHCSAGVFICAAIDLPEQLLQGSVPLQLLILLVLLDLTLQLIPAQ